MLRLGPSVLLSASIASKDDEKALGSIRLDRKFLYFSRRKWPHKLMKKKKERRRSKNNYYIHIFLKRCLFTNAVALHNRRGGGHGLPQTATPTCQGRQMVTIM
ncbi:uncharacterized protein Tco025E_00058, partial [Trypanosoma conorhini]